MHSLFPMKQQLLHFAKRRNSNYPLKCGNMTGWEFLEKTSFFQHHSQPKCNLSDSCEGTCTTTTDFILEKDKITALKIWFKGGKQFFFFTVILTDSINLIFFLKAVCGIKTPLKKRIPSRTLIEVHEGLCLYLLIHLERKIPVQSNSIWMAKGYLDLIPSRTN